MPTAHPDFSHFFQVLSNSVVLVAWQGNLVRRAPPRYLSRPYRFTGVGSVYAGGRWSVEGLMPTVYASADALTLAAEVNHKASRYGLVPAQLRAQLSIGMNWNLQSVVDLTAKATLRALKVTMAQITKCDWEAEQAAGREALTQAIARAAYERLAEALIVPSARRSGGVNVVYYPPHRRDGTLIYTVDEANIPFVHGL